jgi:hypothetical protein
LSWIGALASAAAVLGTLTAPVSVLGSIPGSFKSISSAIPI